MDNGASSAHYGTSYLFVRITPIGPLPFVDLKGQFGLAVAEYTAARDAAHAWFAERAVIPKIKWL
jgi:hypothetical protein